MFRNRRKSASKAKERLQLVLIHDRAKLPPGVMESLRDELIQVIAKHVDIDQDAVHIEITQDGRKQRLIADIPLQSSRQTRIR